jgi:hypothetical protein
MKLFANLTNALLDQVQKGDEIVAVGQLTFDSYKHKQYGKINNPIFKIVEWRTMDDTAPVEEKKPEPESAPRRRAAAPATVTTTPATAGDVEVNNDEDEAALKAEYEAAATAAENPAPRRRVRR